MSEILLTPRPAPVSPVDPDVRPLARAPSQSSEFFNAVYVDSRSGGVGVGVGGGTRPLRVVNKKSRAVIQMVPDRSSTVSVPSSPNSMRSEDSRPHLHHRMLEVSMTLDNLPKPSPSTRPLSQTALIAQNPTKTRGPQHPKLPPSPPLTPTERRTASDGTAPPAPPRAPRAANRPALPPSPVTPSRAPSKALQLLGTHNYVKPASKKRLEYFRPPPNSSLVDFDRLFSSGSRKSSAKQISKTASPDSQQQADRAKQSKSPDFAWLSSDPSVRDGHRTDMGRYASDEATEEDWGMKTLTNVLSVSASASNSGKKVDESFVEIFGDDSAKFKSKARPSRGKPVVSAPHPWSAAALASTPMINNRPPPLVSRHASSGTSSSSSDSSSGPSSPESDVNPTPPRRPKKRPPPLVLDLKPKSGLPIIILNSPPATMLRSRPVEAQARTQPTTPKVGVRQSVQPAQTPFVHPRRAPRPVPKALDLTKAALPRTTDTRMPLLPPVHILTYDHEEMPISVFDPVTPTDGKYPGGMGHGTRDGRGGWLKKVVRDFGHVKL